jgi:hypothetical protein
MALTKIRDHKIYMAQPKSYTSTARVALTTEMPLVILFSTNVRCKCALQTVTPALDEISAIIRWTIDLDDCDKVLRVLASTDVTSAVRKALLGRGYTCASMPY